MMAIVFLMSLILSASLLFVIQPMVAKALLPYYGGTPEVWTLCVMFFQTMVLSGYTYAWILSHRSLIHWWRIIHAGLALLSFFFLAWQFLPTEQLQDPELSLLHNLFSQVGISLLLITASSPLLQYAYSQTGAKDARDPYYLYVASNAGSLIGLVSYPFVIERWLGLNQQFWWWACVFVVYLLCLAYILLVPRYQWEIVDEPMPVIDWKKCFRWVALSFIPVTLMMGMTVYNTTDIAPFPLLWIAPLVVYLSSYMITFARHPLISHQWVRRNMIYFILLPIFGFIIGENQLPILLTILFNITAFAMIALLCHGELNQHRPEVGLLTLFYFCLALGGVLAGLFNSFIAIRLFSGTYEYPLFLSLSTLFLPVRSKSKSFLLPLTVVALLILDRVLGQYPSFNWLTSQHLLLFLALILIVFVRRSRWSLTLSLLLLVIYLKTPWFSERDYMLYERNFYGVKRVLVKDDVHVLMNQNTVHGLQWIHSKKSDLGQSGYYGALRSIIQQMEQTKPDMQVTIVGLGTGIMACLFRSEDRVNFIELDPQIIAIAKNRKYFTYLNDCQAKVSVIEGDGRLALSNLPDHSQDLIVLDAFYSDAIPIHLLTREAFKIYLQKLKPAGVILVNISNRHLDLLPVVTAIARELDQIILAKHDMGIQALGQFSSEWVMLTENEPLVERSMSQDNWHFVGIAETLLWTDNYSNIMPVVIW